MGVLKVYTSGSGWEEVPVTLDHGVLSGLTDDDHIQYLLADGSRQVDGNFNISGDLSVSGYTLFTGRVDAGDPGFEQSGIDILGTTYTTQLRVNDLDASNLAQFVLHRHSTIYQPLLIGARSNSNSPSHAAVVSGQSVLSLYGAGWVGSYYGLFGELDFEAAGGTISDTSSPGRYSIKLTPESGTIPQTVLRLESDKSAEFAGYLTVSSGLDVVDNITVGGTVDGRDIATDGTNLDNHIADTSVHESYFTLHAEENASLNAATYEWAFGNGANTPNDAGVILYVPPGRSGELVAIGLHIGGAISPSATVEAVINGTLQGVSGGQVILTVNNGITGLVDPIGINNGDRFNFYTAAAGGTTGPCAVTAYFRIFG